MLTKNVDCIQNLLTLKEIFHVQYKLSSIYSLCGIMLITRKMYLNLSRLFKKAKFELQRDAYKVSEWGQSANIVLNPNHSFNPFC